MLRKIFLFFKSYLTILYVKVYINTKNTNIK